MHFYTWRFQITTTRTQLILHNDIGQITIFAQLQAMHTINDARYSINLPNYNTLTQNQRIWEISQVDYQALVPDAHTNLTQILKLITHGPSFNSGQIIDYEACALVFTVLSHSDN